MKKKLLTWPVAAITTFISGKTVADPLQGSHPFADLFSSIEVGYDPYAGHYMRGLNGKRDYLLGCGGVYNCHIDGISVVLRFNKDLLSNSRFNFGLLKDWDCGVGFFSMKNSINRPVRATGFECFLSGLRLNKDGPPVARLGFLAGYDWAHGYKLPEVGGIEGRVNIGGLIGAFNFAASTGLGRHSPFVQTLDSLELTATAAPTIGMGRAKAAATGGVVWALKF